MENTKLIAKKNQFFLVAIFALSFVLVGVLCLQYYKALERTVKNESYSYIQEVGTQVANNISRIITDNFAVLGTVSRTLNSLGVDKFEDFKHEAQAQQAIWKYKDILLIDGEGNAYDVDGNSVLLAADEYLRDAVVHRQRSMSSSQVIKGTECIVFVTPVDNIVVDNIPMLALAATYELATLDKILSLNAFEDHSYAHIIRKDGTSIMRSSSDNAPNTGYNILASLASVAVEDFADFDVVRHSIADGKQGVITYMENDSRTIMAYVPLVGNEWYLLGFVPVEVVGAKSELFLSNTLLICGFITLIFSGLVAYLVMTYSRHKRKLEQIAYVDPVTGGNTIDRFYDVASTLLKSYSNQSFLLVYINVEKFKLLNEEFGRETCDAMLHSLYKGIESDLTSEECLGRLSADNFCALIFESNEDVLIGRFTKWYNATVEYYSASGGVWQSPIMGFGVYSIGREPIPFPHMIDRAKLALKESTSDLHGKIRCAVYDDAIRRQLMREKHLEKMMVTSLLNREFQVYLQPKYCAESETIGGAEALVRWASCEGMIYPDEFIPLFEKNGFIVQLDLWVFEEVCRLMRYWADAELSLFKVSVNCSRVHLKNPRFLDRYIEICKRCEAPAQFLEIELTETVVFEDVNHLSNIIDSIHNAGFGCAMDDFGSGYSSLNLISDIPVDTIKLDKVFFHGDAKDMRRTESVVESILSMARALNMSTVAEGIEERTQVEMLKRLKCDYIQGYYFAKPMPVADFERLAFGRTIRKGGSGDS